MKVTYIHHSAFYIEWNKKVLVFDYYDGKSSGGCIYNGKMPEFPEDTEMYVFSSHSHRDHFDMEVLKWSCRYSDIHYIFAKEIKKKLGNSALQRLLPDSDITKLKEKLHYMKPQETLEVAGIKVETLKSTDSGVAFVVTCGEQIIYHAGDLNWWHWEGESEEDNKYQEHTYKEQVDSLKDKHIQVAFVVLDSRQGKDMTLGMDYFLENVRADYVIPMHMWKQYECIRQYKAALQEKKEVHMIEISHENQECLCI